MNNEKDKIDFSINYGPFRISDKVFKNIKINSKIMSEYPSPHGERVIKYLAKFLDIKKENIIISNGSTEIFFLIPKTFKFKKALLFLPSFWEYDFTVSLNKIERIFIGLRTQNNFKFDLKDFKQKIKKVDCVYICNPNNPTSTYIENDILSSLIKKHRSKMFIIDETYLQFFKDYNERSLNKLATTRDNLIVISSLSKIFGLGGIRIGFCVSSKDNIDLIKRFKNPYSINIFAEQLLPALLKSRAHINKTREFMNKEKRRVYSLIAKLLWLAPFKPSANFILVKINNPKIRLERLLEYLEKNGIHVRSGKEFKGLSDRYFRFSIKTRIENNQLLKNLKSFYRASTSS